MIFKTIARFHSRKYMSTTLVEGQSLQRSFWTALLGLYLLIKFFFVWVTSFLINQCFLSLLSRAIALWFIVCRTKQCLDFAATAHFLHLLICWHYNSHFPATLSWWLLNAACVTIMCVYGEYLCLRTELQAIPLSVGPKADL